MEGEKFSDPPIFHVYTKELNRLQPSDRSVVGVLYACVKAVVGTAPAPAVPESGDEYPEVPSNDEYCDPSGSFVRLSDISSRDTLKALTHSVDILAKVVSLSPYTLEMNDSVRRQRLKKLLLPQTAIPSSSRAPYREDMTNFEISARIRLQFHRLLSENGLPLRPLMSQVEQGIKESELLTFSSLAPSDLYRSNQLQEFADMVLKETKALPNFTGALQMGDGEDGSMTRRKYFRFCSALLLAQILSEEHVTEPLVLKRYYPMTDDLLYCLHWPPPDRRNKKDLWKFTLRQLVSRATSKKQSKRSKKVEPVEGDTELVTETTDVSTETVTLTPAGKMILMVKKHGTDAANPYMTAFLHGTTFGVRMVPLDEHRSVDDDEEVDDSEPSSAAVAAATAAAPTAAAPTAPVAPVAGTEESTGDQNASSTELNATSLNLLKCGFFYHTTDDVRYHVFDGPSHDPVVKPDKFGTVCVSARFPQRLQVTACSNGSIQVLSDASVMKEDKVSPTEAEYPLFYEKSRLVGEKGTVYRRFDGKTHPIVAEYLFSDGSRELHLSTDLLQRYRNRSPRTAVAQSTMDDIFEFSLLKLVPLETKIIQLGANGDVVCFCVQQEAAAAGPSSTEDPHVSAAPSTTDLNLEKAIHPAPSSSSSGSHSLKYERLRVNISNIMTTTIDAETKSRVYYYRDGRLLVVYPDESTRVQFPDRTVIQFHPKNKMVYISRFRAWPTIEIDVEVDSMCRGHAQGLEVPINKGGERVRSRVSLPDGSILLVKYDTRVTASSNGSIRLVCRDRTQLLVQDNGQLCFRPFTTWNKDAQQSFDKDLMIEDVVPEVVSHTGLTMAHFTPLADMDHPLLQDTSLNGGSSTTTLPTETSSKVKEDASRVSYQGKQTAAALKAKQRRQDSMNTIKTVPSGATLPPSTAGAGGATNGVATKHLKNEKTSVPDATAKTPEDMDHHELFTSSAEADAVVTVHLRESRLHVLDYEFNAFDVDLTPGRRALLLQRQQEAAMTPAEKKRASSARAQRDDSNTSSNNDESSDPASFTYTVRLAGEVEGLKPPAVARIPKSPRCFIINRFGDATEVLSLQDVSVWECYFKNIGDAYRVEASVTLPPAELGPCRVLRYFVPKRLVSSYLDGFRFDEIVGKRQYCSAVIPAAAQYYLEHQSATLHHVNEEEWLVHHLPRIFEALSLTERHPLSNEGYNRITQAIQRCEEFRQERIKNIDRFAIEDPRTPEQIEEEEMMVKRLKQLYKAAKAVAGKKKEHRSDPMKIEEGDEGEEDEESVVDKRKGPGSLASSPSKVNSARSRGTGSNAGAGVMKGKQHTILEAQNEDEDAEEGDEDEPDFGSEDEKEPDPVEVLIKNTFEDFLSDAYPNGGYNSELLPVSYLQDAFIQMFNRFISPELIEQASYDCGEVDPGLEELTMNEFRAVYFSLDRIINGRTDPHADRNNAGYDNDFTHSQDSYDEDEFDESASRHRSRPTTTTSNNPTYEDEGVSRSRAGRNTASAPPLNFNKLHQDGTPQSSVLGDGSKDPTKWDDGGSLGMGSTTYSEASPRAGTFAAGSGLRMVRNVKSANP